MGFPIDDKIIGMSAALGSACSWAVGIILFKNIGENIPALAMTLAKSLLSMLLLGVVLLAVGFQWLSPRDLGFLLLSGAIGIALGDSLFFLALKELGAHLLVLMFMVGQALTALLALIFLKENVSFQGWLGIAMVILGVGFVINTQLVGMPSKSQLRCIIFGFLSVLCMSSSVIIAKLGVESSSAIQGTFVRMVASSATMVVCGLLSSQLREWVSSFRQIKLAGRLFVAVSVVTFGGFWLSLVAVKYMNVAVANTLISTEPIFALPLAALVLKEKITLRAISGATVAMVGVVLLCLY